MAYKPPSLVAVVVAVLVSLTSEVTAQGIPTGSTIVYGAPDSLMEEFAGFLRAEGDSVLVVDRRGHRLRADVKGAGEVIVFRFMGRGDSTAVTAQGTKGGMAALIMGLGRLQQWLDRGAAPPPDTTASIPSQARLSLSNRACFDGFGARR